MAKFLTTPSSLPTERVCKSINVPNSRDWLGIFDAILLQAISMWAWEQVPDGLVTREEAAAFWETVVTAYWDESACAVSGGAPTPYWDEDSDVDDEETPELQTWYGTVSDPEAAPAELDFVENFAVWTITGFLALATWEIGAAPAILFNTIAPRFVLATKRGDVGEIIRILVDGEESARVDTSGYAVGDVIRTPIIADAALSAHDVMIVQVS